jgi:uroporphyrinogen-III synthase
VKREKQIWITRAMSEEQMELVTHLNLSVRMVPLTKIKYLLFPDDIPPVQAWIFTSQNALFNIKKNKFDGIVYASGKKTAQKLKNLGFYPKSGENENALSLAKKIVDDGVKDALFFCGNQRRNDLPDYLREKNIILKEKVVYETHMTPKKIEDKVGDALFFMSPSAVASFAMINKFKSDRNYYSIGSTTSTALKRFGIKVIESSNEASLESMLKVYSKEN